MEALRIGMLVIHPWHPRWGPGKVVHIDGRRAYIFFRDHLQQKAAIVDMARTRLRLPLSQTDPVLERLPRSHCQGNDWFLPADFQQRMIEADLQAAEAAIRAGLHQASIGRLAISSAAAAIAHLRAMWLSLENDCYELSTDAQPSAPLPLAEAIAVAAPAFVERKTASAVPTFHPWHVGLADAFLDGARGIAIDRQTLLTDAIAAIAASPLTAGVKLARLGDTQLWIHRHEEQRLVYKVDDDARQIVLLTLAPAVGLYV